MNNETEVTKEGLNSEVVFKVRLHPFVLNKQTKKAIKLPLAFFKIFFKLQITFGFFRKRNAFAVGVNTVLNITNSKQFGTDF